MSNFGTTYGISQTGDLFTLESSGTTTGLAKYRSTRGTTVNSPMNYRNLKLFRGFDNEYFFFIKNQDRKPIMLQGITINVILVDRHSSTTVISRKATVVDYDTSQIKVTLFDSETASLNQGLYDMVFSYTNNMGLTMPLFCDLNLRPNYTVEVSEQAASSVLHSAETSTFTEVSGLFTSSWIPASGYFNKFNHMATIGVYATNFTGNFHIQGTLADDPTDKDWFNIILGTYTEEFFPYNNFSGIDPWTFRTNVKLLRAEFTQTQGTLDKVVIRV